MALATLATPWLRPWIRRPFDGRSTAYQRSLRSQLCNTGPPCRRPSLSIAGLHGWSASPPPIHSLSPPPAASKPEVPEPPWRHSLPHAPCWRGRGFSREGRPMHRPSCSISDIRQVAAASSLLIQTSSAVNGKWRHLWRHLRTDVGCCRQRRHSLRFPSSRLPDALWRLMHRFFCSK